MASSMEAQQDLITLHLLCPSLRAPNNFTFENLPLSSTVEELQTRITNTLPNHPPREIQRVIARGKHLSNGNATLREVLAPIDGRQLTIHLMLPVASSAGQNEILQQAPSQPRVESSSAPPAHAAPSPPNTSSSPNLHSPNQDLANLALYFRLARNQASPNEYDPTPWPFSQPGRGHQSGAFIAYNHNSIGILVSPTYVVQGPDGAIPQTAARGPSVFSTSSNTYHPRRATNTNGNINVPPQPNAVNQGQADPLRAGGAFVFRNLWLFIRIFIFAYIFSDPGTWTRWFITIGSLVIMFLAETEWLQAMHGMVVVPFQRYLEGLAHIGERNQQPADGDGNGNGNGALGLGRIWVESFALGRAIILLLASLVPGIGERQVQVRQAAEVERQAEQEREAREARNERENPEGPVGHEGHEGREGLGIENRQE